MDPMALKSVRAPSQPAMFDAALKIGLVALLVYACSRIILPLFDVLLWSAILAVMLYPLHSRLRTRVGNRWSALLIVLVGVALMLTTMAVVVTSLGSSISALVSGLKNRNLTLPSPPPRLADIPLIGQRMAEAWSLLASDGTAALAKYGQTLRKPAAWLVSFAGGLATAELSFILSFAIAAGLVAYGDEASGFCHRLLRRVTGSSADAARIEALTVTTIRGVALGIVGVALLQSFLLGVGFFVFDLPAAGLLTIAALVLAIVQVPTILLTLPLIVYVFATAPTMPAIVFTAWMIVAGFSDNVLKPLMLGHSLEVPMPVILIGVIGGMLAHGLLGLFVGPVLLATGYVLLIGWLRQNPFERGPDLRRNILPPDPEH